MDTGAYTGTAGLVILQWTADMDLLVMDSTMGRRA